MFSTSSGNLSFLWKKRTKRESEGSILLKQRKINPKREKRQEKSHTNEHAIHCCALLCSTYTRNRAGHETSCASCVCRNISNNNNNTNNSSNSSKRKKNPHTRTIYASRVLWIFMYIVNGYSITVSGSVHNVQQRIKYNIKNKFFVINGIWYRTRCLVCSMWRCSLNTHTTCSCVGVCVFASAWGREWRAHITIYNTHLVLIIVLHVVVVRLFFLAPD